MTNKLNDLIHFLKKHLHYNADFKDDFGNMSESNELIAWKTLDEIQAECEKNKFVNCKNCKHSHIADGSAWPSNKHPEYIGRRYCVAWSDGIQGEWVPDNGYCYRAKPRSEDGKS